MNRSELQAAFDASRPALETLVRIQAEYDKVGWRVSEPAAAKFRHICLHLMRTTADFARIAEHNDHHEDDGEPVSNEELRALLGEQGLLIAELAFSLFQLAELGEVNVAVALHDLYRRNAGHFAPESPFADLEPIRYDEQLIR
jgi:hypothetical protein